MKPFSHIIFVMAVLTSGFWHTPPVQAQLQIAPTAIYMDRSSNTGRIVIRNSSDKPVDVEIGLVFGYPATDDEGKVIFKLYEEIPEGQPSAVEWIRIYPRFFELPSGSRQTVRFSARPPANLDDGEYWARPTIVAQVPSVQKATLDDANIHTQINLRKRTILALNYRNGQVHTGISIENLTARFEQDSVKVSAGLERLGNAAFLGHYDLRLVGPDGNVLRRERKEIAVYHHQKRAFEFSLNHLAPGIYSVELELFTNDRNTDGIIQTSPVTGTATFTIP